MTENGDGTFCAQPDNGFGTKANSGDFQLRLYRVRPDWETAGGGPGRIKVQRFITLHDPDHRIPFAIQNEQTSDRLLTGADLDIESLVSGADGTFWIGDEFGPFRVVRGGLHARSATDAPCCRTAPGVRPQNTAFNGLYRIPTFDEVLDLARHSRACDGGSVGVYPETKHPTYFDDQGLSLEEPLLATLKADGYGTDDPVFIQSFETGNLRQFDRVTDFPLVQLVDCAGAPYDLKKAGDPRTYAGLVTRRAFSRSRRTPTASAPARTS